MATSCGSFLILLSWIYVVAWLCGAAPVPPPDMNRCQTAYKPDQTTKLNCCIPYNHSEEIADFTFPSPQAPVRVRRAAHLAGDVYINRYTHAVHLMKKLDPSDPWNFMQQANVHCAYCDGAYYQNGTDVELQVHSSWLFFPYHRASLYFYERILGKLIGDDTFAIPYWNWDHPDGMMMPDMYSERDECGQRGHMNCSLFDELRDAKHLRPTIANLDFDGNDTAGDFKKSNLRVMYRQMVRNSATARLFFGHPYMKGDSPSPGAGSVEQVPHNTMHDWTGDRQQEFHEHMGVLFAAARDPIFYSHHANVDRMWEIWKTLPGKNRQDLKTDDWLDASFVFWDENRKLVRVRVRDLVDTSKLGYTYEKFDTPWLQYKPIVATAKKPPVSNEPVKYPIVLNKAVTVPLTRLKVGRSAAAKQLEEEMLVVDKIKVSKTQYVKFDVYINADPSDDAAVTVDSSQFAGSFVSMPMMEKEDDATKGLMAGGMTTTSLTLGLTELLDDTGADADERITVTLVPKGFVTPRSAANPVTVGDIRIEFS